MAEGFLRATLAVVRILQDLGLEYLIGGSLASSLHGIPRSTEDADIVVDLPPERVAELLTAFGDHFYVDAQRAREAVTRRASFNVLHLETMFKVDLFVLGDDALARREMERRERYRIGESEDEEVFVASAEDTILQKLRWYRLGNEVSDRQWRDLLGVLRVQGDRLDREYLLRSADEMGLRELLDEALDEVGGRLPPR